MAQNKRQHYRIIYNGKYPVLDSILGKFSVLDISERGVRFIIKGDQNLFEIGKLVEGKISLPEGRGEVKIKGRVLRILLNEIVLTLDEKAPIPLKFIMDEQRALIKKGKLSAG